MSGDENKSRTLEGIIDHNVVFQTFTKQTEQKKTHGLILQSLMQELQNRNILFPFQDQSEGDDSSVDEISTTANIVSLVDLGCGDGTTAREMITAFAQVLLERRAESGQYKGHKMHNTTKLRYFGLDASECFVESTRRVLKDIACSEYRDILVDSDVDIRQANAVGRDPLLLPKPIDNALLTMGHVLYYANSNSGGKNPAKDDVGAVVANIQRLLGEQSMALFVHSAARCTLGLIRESVAGSVVIARPSVCLSEIVHERGWELVSFVVPYWIQFPRRLTVAQWEDCKNPDQWGLARNKNDSKFTILLELLMFIAQRSLRDLARENKMNTFVDAIQSHLDEHDKFEGLSDYQILLSPTFGHEEKKMIREAVIAATAKCIPENK